MKLAGFAVSALALAAVGTAGAVTVDGDLSTTTSVGTADVIVIKDNAVQISDVDEFRFEGTAGAPLGNLAAGDAAATQSDDVCVFSTTGEYDVLVTSDSGTFELQPDTTGGDTIAYAVTWDGDDPTQAGGLADLTGNSTSPTCGGTPNVTVEVTLDVTEFNAAAPDTYSDVITMTISPS